MPKSPKASNSVRESSSKRPVSLPRRLVAEAIGTSFFLASIVGSGIMGDTLSPDNVGVALLGSSLPPGAMLVVIILIFGPISGGHFNPAVTLSFALRRKLPLRDAAAYVVVQIASGILGAWFAHIMFGLDVIMVSENVRYGGGIWFAEFLATFGLLGTILSCAKYNAGATAYAVGLYIFSGWWFTASTSFANPAVAIARSLTNTFTGIRPGDMGFFVVFELLGALSATLLFIWLLELPPISFSANEQPNGISSSDSESSSAAAAGKNDVELKCARGRKSSLSISESEARV